MTLQPKDIEVSFIQAEHEQNLGNWSTQTYSGVVLYHKPSGIRVSCAKHKSQYRNKSEAMLLLEEELLVRDDTKEVFTYEEMTIHLKRMFKDYPQLYRGKTLEQVLTPFEESGFQCVCNFLKLECGWVISHESICPQCVDHLVREFGTEKEKEMLAWVRSCDERF